MKDSPYDRDRYCMANYYIKYVRKADDFINVSLIDCFKEYRLWCYDNGNKIAPRESFMISVIVIYKNELKIFRNKKEHGKIYFVAL